MPRGPVPERQLRRRNLRGAKELHVPRGGPLPSGGGSSLEGHPPPLPPAIHQAPLGAVPGGPPGALAGGEGPLPEGKRSVLARPRGAPEGAFLRRRNPDPGERGPGQDRLRRPRERPRAGYENLPRGRGQPRPIRRRPPGAAPRADEAFGYEPKCPAPAGAESRPRPYGDLRPGDAGPIPDADELPAVSVPEALCREALL